MRALCVLLALATACRSHDADRSRTVALLPGAPPVAAELAARIRAAAPAGAHHVNRLALEKSPYLRQHADNPVDWYPWGDEAFAAARRMDRPVLLSIGYSTCHWCHVMAAESFEDVAIATYLNQHYVSIKVDREERPDVDAIYMQAMEAMGRRGGWPLHVWLTADGKPFFGATYLPPGDEAGGFLAVLRNGREAHAGDRARLDTTTAEVVSRMEELGALAAGDDEGELDGGAIARAMAAYREAFDVDEGGLRRPGARNKFPADLPVRLLLRAARRGEQGGEPMAVLTLERMAAGGIRDHVGGGFHRYATDARWRVPHFEKMLYDNALLAVAYLEAYQATGRADFAAVAREIVDFAERELSAPEGGFHAALDADSLTPDGTRVEGLFYTWTPAEVAAAVGAADAPLVQAWFAVSDAGNLDGRTVLATPRPLGEVAAALGIGVAAARETLDRARVALAAARDARPRPHRDDKVIAAWNGLMVSALVRAALVLDRGAPGSPALERARRAGRFLLTRMVRGDGTLARVWIDGEARGPSVLDDHVAVIAAWLDLFEATGEIEWLDGALALDAVLARDFEDDAGGFYLTARGTQLLVRHKPVEDGALPSGNSIAAMNLERLAALTGEARFRERADRLWRALSGEVLAIPTIAPELLLALDVRLARGPEIVLVAPGSLDELAPYLAALADRFVPHRITVPLRSGDVAALAKRIPLVDGKLAIDGRPTAFVCRERVCRLPATDVAGFIAQLAAAE